MTFLDFFAGIGGFRLGLEMADHKCLGFCEYDKFAVASYRAMHDTEGGWFSNDIRELRANDIPRADCWCFGFPCQDISVAGKQLGFDGKRSSLFFTTTRLIRDTKEKDRPGTLFIENVKNLLSVNGGVDFLKLLIELDEIGYDTEWQVLNSKDYGVPQNRERVFIVGHFRGRSRREVFPVGGTNEATDIPIKIIAHRNGYRRNTQVFEPTGITEALDTGAGGGRGHYTILSDSGQGRKWREQEQFSALRVGGDTQCVKIIGNVNPSGNGMNGNVFDSEGLAPTLTTNKGEGNKIAIPVLTPDRAEKRQNGRRFKEDGEPMFTLTGQDRHGVSDGSRIRKLTPKECFRLQGFPDEYFERAAKVNSNSQLYKQAGNSVTVPVIFEIAERL